MIQKNLPIESVPSASFTVKHSSELELEALLGTCVGVALVDKKNKIGGLFHILLPEPLIFDTPWDKETFASEGLPLFLQKVLAAGADKENLVATVAGGALIGPLMESDIQMNIGGRTTEIVRKFLSKNNIPIERSETGGYAGIILKLNLHDMTTRLEPIGYEKVRNLGKMKKAPPFNLENAVKEVRPIPQIALKIIKLIQSENYDMAEVKEEVMHDQVLAAKVIKMSNSSWISPKRPIESIQQALVMLGELQIIEFVLNHVLYNMFSSVGSGYSLRKGGLYKHSVITGIISERISLVSGKSKPGVAYTAGLLHDIGKVVLDQSMASVYPLLYQKIYKEKISLIELEKKIMEITHPEAGRELGEYWNLPQRVVDVIEHHHQPENSKQEKELAHIVYLANLLATRFCAGDQLDIIDKENLRKRIDVLDLCVDDIEDIILQIPWKRINTELV